MQLQFDAIEICLFLKYVKLHGSKIHAFLLRHFVYKK